MNTYLGNIEAFRKEKKWSAFISQFINYLRIQESSPSSSQSTSEFNSVGAAKKFTNRADRSTYYRQASNSMGSTQRWSTKVNNADECRQGEASGSQCGKKGHIFKMCPQRNNFKATDSTLKKISDGDVEHSNDTFHDISEYIDNSRRDDDRYRSDVYTIKDCKLNSIENDDVPPHFETIKINDIPLRMEADSGAIISAISLEVYQKHFGNISINKSNLTLRSYDGISFPR